MHRIVRLALATAVLLAATAQAQETVGGGGTGTPRGGPELPTLPPLTADIMGEVLQIDTQRNAIQIRNKRTGRPMGLLLDAKCKIKADKKQFGKKELTLEELGAGYLVELTVRRADMHIIEMRVKKPKEKTSSEGPPPSGN